LTPPVIALPPEVAAYLDERGSEETQVVGWTLPHPAHRALGEALGRGLSADTMDFIASRRLAMAAGDELRYPKSRGEARELVARCTTIVQRLEWTDPLFARAVRELNGQTGRRVAISAYVADVDSQRFSWHVDRWDNVVLQLRGRKAFELRGDTGRELRPGDALFMPQDVEHRARTIERSVHVSLAFFSESSSPVGGLRERSG
jgi:quercetin dioxygenase-like cupin family protein